MIDNLERLDKKIKGFTIGVTVAVMLLGAMAVYMGSHMLFMINPLFMFIDFILIGSYYEERPDYEVRFHSYILAGILVIAAADFVLRGLMSVPEEYEKVTDMGRFLVFLALEKLIVVLYILACIWHRKRFAGNEKRGKAVSRAAMIFILAASFGIVWFAMADDSKQAASLEEVRVEATKAEPEVYMDQVKALLDDGGAEYEDLEYRGRAGVKAVSDGEIMDYIAYSYFVPREKKEYVFVAPVSWTSGEPVVLHRFDSVIKCDPSGEEPVIRYILDSYGSERKAYQISILYGKVREDVEKIRFIGWGGETTDIISDVSEGVFIRLSNGSPIAMEYMDKDNNVLERIEDEDFNEVIEWE